ncbi:MAG: metalloregulator ArsR/SmtB family transcription factor [Arcanobacterium sp.]|nr:metalloregulator ArsR/SmtB family transcription factor [Arcanobacterium sp.]
MNSHPSLCAEDCCSLPHGSDIDATATALRVLGDPVRLRIVTYIAAAQSPICICSMLQTFNVSQPTLSQHLKKLVQAKILRRTMRNTSAYYTLESAVLTELGDILAQWGAAAAHTAASIAAPITILFACRQNAGRSQIAAAIARSIAPAGVTILCAGTTPAKEIHPTVRTALAELGLEPANPTPQKLTPETVAESDWVITMGCGETCPIFLGKHYEDWEVADPAEADLPQVRTIIADIRTRVEQLLRTVAPQ